MQDRVCRLVGGTASVACEVSGVGSRTGSVFFPNLFLRVDYQGLEILGYHNDIGQWLALATSYSSKEQDSYQG